MNFSSSRLLKGALVTLDPPDPTPHVIMFQYNPGTLTRSLEAQMSDNEKGGDLPRFHGAPVETIKLEVEIDATDQLEKKDPDQQSDVGVLPQLAALELLLYPKSGQVMLNNTLMQLGTIEILPSVAPLTLFIWGQKRILPVRLTEFSVTEDAHRPNLSPIRAKVSLGLRVLSYSDATSDNPVSTLFMAHQVIKEGLAAGALVDSLNAVMGSNVRLI